MLVGLLYLLAKLCVLALLYFGIEWLIGGYPDKIDKIFAAILVLIGAAMTLQWLGVF